MKIEELRIPAPWGHIAVKTWNEPSSEAILVTHGYMDNVASFDNLLPLLPKQFYYICFDLPGHGLSDHFPKGTFLMTLDYLLVFKIMVDYFKRDSYIFLGHSYGAQIGILFSQLYPDYIKKIIVLDTISFKPINFFLSLEVGMDLILNEKQRKVYSFEEAVNKITQNRAFGKVDKKSAENLAKRSLEKISENQYVFRMDPRLKERINPTWEFDYLKQTHLKFPVKCQGVFIFFNESPFHRIFKLIYEHLRDRGFEIHHLDGNHDYHITHPEVVVPIITEFLLRRHKL
nr:serine hydrolase-like protein isoform X3 [Onthophagus taurus]